MKRLLPFGLLLILTALALPMGWQGRKLYAGEREEAITLTPLAHLGGRILAIAARDDRAYVLEESQIVVYDLSQTPPREVGRSPRLGLPVDHLLVEEDRIYAYVENGYGALYILSRSDTPTLLGEAMLWGRRYWLGQGMLALVTGEDREVHFWDVSDPRHPREVGRYKGDFAMENILLHDEHVYLCGYNPLVWERNHRLITLDVRNFSRPRIVHSQPVAMNCVDGHFAQVDGQLWAVGKDGIQVFDLTNPAHPTLRHVLAIAPGDWKSFIHKEGDLLYVGIRGYGVTIYDIHDSEHPQRMGSVPVADAREFALAGSTMAVRQEQRGWSILSIADPHQPEITASLAARFVNIQDLYVHDGLVFMVESTGFTIFDARDPTHPQPIFTIPLTPPEHPSDFDYWQVYALDHWAYLGVDNELHIYDIADLSAIHEVKTIQVPGFIHDITSFQGRIYVGCGPVVAMDPAGNDPIVLPRNISAAKLRVHEQNGRRYLYTGWGDVVSLSISSRLS